MFKNLFGFWKSMADFTYLQKIMKKRCRFFELESFEVNCYFGAKSNRRKWDSIPWPVFILYTIQYILKALKCIVLYTVQYKMTIFKNVYIFRKQNCLFCTVYKINTLHFNKRNFVYKSTVQYKISQYKTNTVSDDGKGFKLDFWRIFEI